MAKTTLRAKTRTIYLWAVGALLILISVGLFYLYRENNFGATDSDAGSSPKLALLSSSISKLNPKKGETFTVKCNYLIPYSKETKQFDGIKAAKETAKGIYIIGEDITCTKDKLANESEPGNVSFSCKSSKEGIYAVGCGIEAGTKTIKLEKTTKQNCTTIGGETETTYKDVGSTCANYGTSSGCVCYDITDGKEVIETKCRIPITKTSPKEKVCGPVFTQRNPVPQDIDILNSYKIIDYVKVGNPIGSANCVVPAYMRGVAYPATVSKSRDTEIKAPMFSYDARCVYALKDSYDATSVVITADKASCATSTSGAEIFNRVAVKDLDFVNSKCTIKTGTKVGSKITTKCSFVASTINEVKICGRTDLLNNVTIVE